MNTLKFAFFLFLCKIQEIITAKDWYILDQPKRSLAEQLSCNFYMSTYNLQVAL